MAKRIIKDPRIKEIIKNIAQDFRHSNELDDYALLFYKYENEDKITGGDIDKMIEYCTTGLTELHKDLAWRQEYLSENPNMNEARLLENMFTIEQEYKELLAFLQK